MRYIPEYYAATLHNIDLEFTVGFLMVVILLLIIIGLMITNEK